MLYAGVMRAVAMLLAFASLGCPTAPNPEFGDTSTGGGGTESDATTTSTTSTTTMTSTSASTTMPMTETGATMTADESSSTGEPPRTCCNEDDCSQAVVDCMCELPGNESCCTGPWDPACENIAIACGGICDGVVYSCCEPQGMPACTGVQTIDNFCIGNFQCCVVEWQPSCVAAYDEATGACALETCMAAHASPGCERGDVMQCVCRDQDLPQCCTEMWHEDCVAAAMQCPG